MIGILVVTHGNSGTELLKSAELIIGKQENVKALSLNQGDNVEELCDNVSKSIKQLDKGDGVLVLTDLFGGSPSNVTATNMKNGHFQSLAGVNLPRNNEKLEELVDKVYTSGVEGIRNIRHELFVNSSV